MNVFELFAKLGLDSSEYEKGLKEAENHGKTFGGRLGSALGTAAKAAGVALTASATAVVGFGASSVKSGMEFDAAMQKVRAISGANNEQFVQLRDTAQEMGATTKFSATEAANAMEYMAMAGWKTEDMLGGISGIMNLAAASGEDLATTSDIVTDALTAFGMQAGESSHFADILAAAATNSNTNVGMMGETFKYVAPVAGALGYTAEDVAVAIGLMANSGIKASQAGTSLRGLFTRLAKEPKEAAQAMKVLGVSLDDGAGNMYSFREVMQQLRTSFNQNLQIPASEVRGELERLNAKLEEGTITQSEYDKEVETLTKRAYGAEGALKAQYAAMLAGTNGMSGLLAIVNSSDEDWAKLTATIDGCSDVFVKTADGSIMSMNQALAEGLTWTEEYIGSAEAIATLMEDTLQGDITSLKSAFEGLQIAVSDRLTPSFREFVQFARDGIRALTVAFKQDGLQGAIDALGPTIERGVELLIGVAPKVIEVAMLLLISFVNAIAQNLDKIIPAAIALVMTFGKGIIDALPTIRDGILAGIMALLDSLGLGDVVRNFLENISGPVQEALEKIRSTASAAFERIRAALEPLIQRFQEYVGSGQAMADVSNVAATVIDVLATVISKMIEFVASAVEKGAAFVEWLTSGSTSAETFKTVLAAVVGGVVAFIAEFKVLNAVTQAAHAIFGALPAVISLLTSPITLVIAAVAALAAGFVYLYNTNETFKNFVDTAWETIKEVIVSAIENIKAGLQALGEFFAPLIESIKGFLSALIEFAKSAAGAIGEYLKAFYESHKTQIDAFFTTVKAIVSGAIDLIKGILTTAFTYIRDAVKGTIDVVTGILNTLSALLKGDFKGAWDAAKETVKTFKENVVETITNLGENISKALGDLAKHALDWGKDMLANFINGIKEKWNDLKQAVHDTAQKIKDFLGFSKPKEGPLSDADAYGGDFIKLWISGMQGEEGNLGTAVKNIATLVYNGINDTWETAKTLGNALIERINGGTNEKAESLISGAGQIATQTRDILSMTWEGAKAIGSNFISLLHNGITEKATELVSAVTNFATQIPQIIANAWNNIKAYGSNLVDQLSSGVSERASVLVQVVQNIITIVGDAFSKAWQNAKVWGANLIAQIYNGIAEKASSVLTAVQNIIKNVSDALTKGWANAKTIGSNLITNISNGISSVASGLNNTVSTIAKNVIDWIRKTWENAKTLGLNLITRINNGISEKISTLSNSIKKVVKNVNDAFSNGWKNAKTLGSNLLSNITNGISGKISSFNQIIQRIGKSVTDYFGNIGKSMTTLGSNIAVQLRNGIAQKASDIGNVFTQIFQHIVNAVRQVIDAARSWGNGLMTSFVNGMVEKFNSLVDRLRQMGSAIKSYLHFSQPDKGPLSGANGFESYAPDMMKTFAKGIRDNTHLVTDQISRSFDFGDSIGTNFDRGSVVSAGSVVGGNRDINIFLELDGMVFARAVYKANNEETQRVGVKLAGGFA